MIVVITATVIVKVWVCVPLGWMLTLIPFPIANLTVRCAQTKTRPGVPLRRSTWSRILVKLLMVEDKNRRDTFVFHQKDKRLKSEEQPGGTLKLENRKRTKKMSVFRWKGSC